MLDQLRQIAIFAKTMDHGSFRAAASELRLSPSVVSHHISQLEEHLGVALLYRSTRKIALTQEGAQLLVAAQDMLEAAERGLADLEAGARQRTGELRLTAPSVLAQSRLTEELGNFAQAYPGVRLSLNFTDLREELIADGLDVAIRMGVTKKHEARSKTLYRVARRVVGAPRYVSGRSVPRVPQDLADWHWLTLDHVHRSKTKFTREGFDPVSLKLNPHIRASDVRALYHLACTGAGIAIVPEVLIEGDLGRGDVAVVLPDWQLSPVEVYAVWPTNAPKHGLIQLLIDWLARELG